MNFKTLLVAGPNCNRCANNYFGNPLVPGGTCQPCQCNNNIDPESPGNCDAKTGRCIQCVYNTEGFNCERCSAGFYGNAREQNCQGMCHSGNFCEDYF